MLCKKFQTVKFANMFVKMLAYNKYLRDHKWTPGSQIYLHFDQNDFIYLFCLPEKWGFDEKHISDENNV